MNVPTWAKKYLDAEGIQKIEAKIQEAELSTEAEIVVCIRESSSTRFIFDVVWFAFSMAFFLLGTLTFQIYETQLKQGLSSYTHSLFLGLEILFLVLFLFGWAYRMKIIRTLFRRHFSRITQAYAFKEFSISDIQKTQESTGILIFISLLEQMVHVLADKKVTQKIANHKWQDSVQKIVKCAEEQNLSQGLIQVLEDISPKLHALLPALAKNNNELPNHLIFRSDEE